MRTTQKIDDILPRPAVQLIKLDADELGKLIKAKALQAVAMHFASMGLKEPVQMKSSANHDPVEDLS